jgi:hypothetical protein
MAEQKPATTAEFYDGLIADLRACDTIAELFKLGSSAEFQNDVSLLGDAEQNKLRAFYIERQSVLDNRVKLDEFDGQTVLLVGVEAWTSEYGDGVTLHITREMSDKTFKALSSSAAIVRFCQRLNPLPTEKSPYRVHLAKVPVSNPVDAAKGFKRWTIKMLPMSRDARSTGAPF